MILMMDYQETTKLKLLGDQMLQINPPQAINFYTKAIQKGCSDHTVYSNRSFCYVKIGQYDLGLDDAQQSIKINPEQAIGYKRKGTALLYLGQPEKAFDSFKSGLKYNSGDIQLRQGCKLAEQKIKNYQNLMNDTFLQVKRKLKNNPETEKYIQDEDLIEKVYQITKNPQKFSTFSHDPRIMKAFEVISTSSLTSSENKKFVPQMQKEEQIPKQEQKTLLKDPSEYLKNKGNEEFRKKNFQMAIRLYEEAIQLKPEEPLYYSNKATAYVHKRKFQNAHEELDKAEKLFEQRIVDDCSKRAKIYSKRGFAFSKQNKLEEAIEQYEKSLAQNEVQSIKEELKVLKKRLMEKEDIDPEIAQRFCQRGNSLFKQGKFLESLKEYEEAIRKNPDVAKYYHNLGLTYKKMELWEKACQNLQICLEKDPNYVKAYSKKGDCHFHLKQFDSALEAYEQGLKKDPENKLCKEGIEATQKAIYNSKQNFPSEDEKQRQKEIQEILKDQEVKNAIIDLQNNAQAMNKILKNKNLAIKIQKLIQAGILR